MYDVIEKFLLHLNTDNDWHNLSEVAKVLRLTQEKALIIAQFLARYKFIHFNVEQKRVKIDKKLAELGIYPIPKELTELIQTT